MTLKIEVKINEFIIQDITNILNFRLTNYAELRNKYVRLKMNHIEFL